jgi:hypothetical protein
MSLTPADPTKGWPTVGETIVAWMLVAGARGETVRGAIDRPRPIPT